MERAEVRKPRRKPRQARSRATVDAIEDFSDREAILDEVRARHGRWLAEATRRGLDRGQARPLRERVRDSLEQMVALHGGGDPLHRVVAAPLAVEDFGAFRDETERFLRAHAAMLRPVEPALAAVVITRAVEAVVYGVSREEPEWLRHRDFLDEVTQLVLGYLAPGDGQASSEGA